MAGSLLIAGIDEVGRGCIAGPVVAAAVVFPEGERPVEGLADSKTLTPMQREHLAAAIRRHAVAWAIGRAEVPEIDRLNILQASLLAMRRAYLGLAVEPTRIRVDGNRAPDLARPTETVVGGDRIVPAISAASILAKVFRDGEMAILDGLFPGLGFAVHKGYPTGSHRAALRRLGPTAVHRRSFAPVKRYLAGAEIFSATDP